MNLEFLDDIRAALDSPQTANVNLLADIAAEYSESVVKTNRRMREVTRLLDKGLRGEAMQLAGQNPFVLETVSTLDLPELIEWRTLLSSLGMELPPGLRMDFAERIDNAYAEIRPLEDLLRRHRALALGKAPLQQRIYILQKLLDRDPGNPGWTEDLANLQSARLKQIPATLKKAMARNDHKVIRSLSNELSKPWLIPVPRSLIEEINFQRQSFDKDSAREKLAEIAPALNDAFVARDADAGRVAREQWLELAAVAELSESDALTMETREPLEWLEQEDFGEVHSAQFDVALQAVDQAIQNNAPLEKLDPLITTANRFQLDWPGEIQTRASKYRKGLKQQKTVKSIAMSAGVLGLLGLIVGGGWYFMQQSKHNTTVSDAYSSLNGLVENNDLIAAESVFNSLSADIQNDTRLSVLKSKLETGLADLDSQSRLFQSSFEAAKQAGIEQPDFTSLDRATESAVSDSQQDEVTAFMDQINRHQLGQLKQRDQKFESKLVEYSSQVSQLAKSSESESTTQIEKLIREMIQWKSDHTGKVNRQPLVSAELIARADTLKEQLQNMQVSMVQMATVNNSLKELTLGLTSQEDFLPRLKEFRSTIGADHFLAAEINQAISELEEKNYWDGFAAVSDFISKTNWERTLSSPAVASKVLTNVTQIQEDHSDIWLTDHLTDRVPHLDSIEARNSPDGRTIRSKFIDGRLGGFWKNGGVLSLPDGTTYFLPEVPQFGGARTARLSFMASRYLDTRKKEFLAPNGANGVVSGMAPHTNLYAAIEVALGTLPTKGWQATFADVIERILLTEETEMDPVIRNFFLYSALDASIAGDHAFSGLSEMRDRAKDIQRAGADWAKVARGEADQETQELYDDTRRRAVLLFQEMKLLKSWKEDAEKETAKFLSIGTRDDLGWQAVGMVIRDEQMNWSVAGFSQSESVQQLYCLYQKQQEDFARFHAIGTANKDKIKFVAPGELVSGRAVFVRSPKPGN